MSVWRLLRHQLREYWRVPFLGRRFLSVVLGGVVVLYAGGMLVLLGLLFDDLVHALAPGADPLLVASRWLLPVGIGYAALRVVMESGLGVNLRPYLFLPIRRSFLVVLIVLRALLSAWNAVPLLFVAAVGIESAASGAGGEALRFGIAGLGILIALTFIVPLLRAVLSSRPFLAAGAVLLAVGSVSIEVGNLSGSLPSLLDVSGWMLGGVVRGAILPSVLSVVLIGVAGFGFMRRVWNALFIDWELRCASSWESRNDLSFLTRHGPAFREAVMELRLILRTVTPRTTLFMVSLFVGVNLFAGYLVDDLGDLGSLMNGMDGLNTFVWQGLFGTGAFMIFHGVMFFSWEGGHWEATMARPVSPRARVQGKWFVLAASAVACFLLPLPFLVLWGSPFSIFHTAFFLYNVGVLAPAVVAGATFNRKAIEPNQLSLLGHTDFSVGRAAISLPVYFLPLALLFLLDDPMLQLGIIGGIGLLALLALPLWFRFLADLYCRNRYARARGFRATRG